MGAGLVVSCIREPIRAYLGRCRTSRKTETPGSIAASMRLMLAH